MKLPTPLEGGPPPQKARKGKHSDSSVPMPARYAGAENRMLVAAQTRLQTCEAFYRFLGSPRGWRAKIPLQANEEPSFLFLVPALPPVGASAAVRPALDRAVDLRDRRGR